MSRQVNVILTNKGRMRLCEHITVGAMPDQYEPVERHNRQELRIYCEQCKQEHVLYLPAYIV